MTYCKVVRSLMWAHFVIFAKTNYVFYVPRMWFRMTVLTILNYIVIGFATKKSNESVSQGMTAGGGSVLAVMP